MGSSLVMVPMGSFLVRRGPWRTYWLPEDVDVILQASAAKSGRPIAQEMRIRLEHSLRNFPQIGVTSKFEVKNA